MLYALPFCPLPLRAPPVQSRKGMCVTPSTVALLLCARGAGKPLCIRRSPLPRPTIRYRSFVTHSSTLQFHALKSVYGEIESLKSIAHSIAEPRRGKNTKYTCDTGQGIWQACFQSRATMAADRPPRCRLRRERVEGRLCLVCVCGCSWECGYVCLSSPRAFWQCCGRRMK